MSAKPQAANRAVGSGFREDSFGICRHLAHSCGSYPLYQTDNRTQPSDPCEAPNSPVRRSAWNSVRPGSPGPWPVALPDDDFTPGACPEAHVQLHNGCGQIKNLAMAHNHFTQTVDPFVGDTAYIHHACHITRLQCFHRT